MSLHNKTFTVTWSINYAKIDEFNYLDWFTKWDTIFVTNWGKYYKVRQLYYKMGQTLLQTRAISRYYRIGEDIL